MEIALAGESVLYIPDDTCEYFQTVSEVAVGEGGAKYTRLVALHKSDEQEYHMASDLQINIRGGAHHTAHY